MTVSPPLFAGAVHEKATYVFDVIDSSLTNVVGGSGATSAIGIAAPFPSEDIAESPMALIEVTRAIIVAESSRLYGAARSVRTGMVQLLAEIMPELFSASQFVKSFSKVFEAVLISSL